VMRGCSAVAVVDQLLASVRELPVGMVSVDRAPRSQTDQNELVIETMR